MRIGIVGDMHHRWDDADVAWFDRSDLDLLLFTGDLAGNGQKGRLAVARRLARLRKPSLLVPGNHDGPRLGALLGEVLQQPALVRAFAGGTERRWREVNRALGPVVVGGYSRHRFGDVDVVVGRPYSMGGPGLSFGPQLRRAWGVGSLQESAERISALVQESDAPHLVLLAHNGPAGLGARRDSIWGKDFDRSGGDFGDADLAQAAARALELGKPLRAVVAGHMHLRLRGGGERPWRVERDGVLFVNAARVPRHRSVAGRTQRHHVRMTLGRRVEAREVWV